jgi:hypothetical protein
MRKKRPMLTKTTRSVKLNVRRKDLPGRRPKKRQDFHLRPSCNSKERRTLKLKKMKETIYTRKRISLKPLSSTPLP